MRKSKEEIKKEFEDSIINGERHENKYLEEEASKIEKTEYAAAVNFLSLTFWGPTIFDKLCFETLSIEKIFSSWPLPNLLTQTTRARSCPLII